MKKDYVRPQVTIHRVEMEGVVATSYVAKPNTIEADPWGSGDSQKPGDGDIMIF